MNNPQCPVTDELRWMSAMGLDFIDLTIEPPAAASWKIDPKELRRAITDARIGVVGHTAYYLPIASPFEGLRRAAIEEIKRCLEIFAELGARAVNVHPDRYAPMHDRGFVIGRNRDSLSQLLQRAHELGLDLMVENTPGDFNDAAQLAELLVPLPDLKLHLDVGHANLRVPENTTAQILQAFGPRLRHVHIHDNKGGYEDLHLPLGVGTVDVRQMVHLLKRAGYDGTITLEVFTPDRRHLAFSRDLLRAAWDERPVMAERVAPVAPMDAPHVM
jgi:sugar phosphate isomerase/epimerase